jgi:hypothetical protein
MSASILVFLSTNQVLAQSNILEKFTATQVNDKVVLSWIIEKGSTCNGIDIERADDSMNFITIGHIDGICGDERNSKPYSFVDESPLKNSINYYRLELGSVGPSKILSISVISLGDNGYLLKPNPFLYESLLFFENFNNEQHELVLYTMEGKEILREVGNDNYFKLKKNDLSDGMYLFVLKNLVDHAITKGQMVIGGQ